jgi:hypothetical protein
MAVYLGCSENVLARQHLPSGATDDSYAYIETGAKTSRCAASGQACASCEELVAHRLL